MRDHCAAIAAEIREGGRAAPPVERRIERPPQNPTAPGRDRRGREIASGDPILFAVPSGSFAGVYAGTYRGRSEGGRMRAQIAKGEPKAGAIVEIAEFSTLRIREADLVAEVRASVTREILRLEGRAL